jgi:hypothetical protein
MRTFSHLLALVSLALAASCSRQDAPESRATLPHPDTTTGAQVQVPKRVAQQARNKQGSVDKSIIGTWVLDPEFPGTLGAFELVKRSLINPGPDIEVSLVLNCIDSR